MYAGMYIIEEEIETASEIGLVTEIYEEIFYKKTIDNKLKRYIEHDEINTDEIYNLADDIARKHLSE